MERKQFTFFASYGEAAMLIKDKTARCEFYDAIVFYALNGDLPDIDNINEAAAIGFVMAKPTLDSGAKKAESGAVGGRRNASKEEADEEQKESKSEANDKQTGSKPKAPRKQTESDNEASRKQAGSDKGIGEGIGEGKEEEKENEGYSPPLTPPTGGDGEKVTASQMVEASGLSPPVKEALHKWLAYKQERRESYKETGFSALLTTAQKHEEKYGADAVVDLITQSMANHYAGITWDRIRGAKPATRAAPPQRPGGRKDDLERLEMIQARAKQERGGGGG